MVHISHHNPKRGKSRGTRQPFLKPEVRNQMGGLHQLFTGPEGGAFGVGVVSCFFGGTGCFFFGEKNAWKYPGHPTF